MRLDVKGAGAFRDAELALKARFVATKAAHELKAKKSGGWKQAAFARGGDSLLVEPTRRLRGRSRGFKIEIASCLPQGVDNLLVCSPAIDVDDKAANALHSPLNTVAIALVVAQADWDKLCADGQDLTDADVILATNAKPVRKRLPNVDVRFNETAKPIYRTAMHVDLGELNIPIVAECDVLVVGGGTSGVPAALVASKNGMDTILIEKHSDLGGTHTIGGVSVYWFGRKTDFVRRLDRSASTLMSQTGMPKCVGILDLLMRTGTRVVPQCLAAGVLVKDNQVRGIVVVTPNAGLAAITSKVVIDATGDGDLAAWAGADYAWGTTRDAMVMWYSFAHFMGAEPEANRQFQSPLDARDATDLSRAIITARRRGGLWGKKGEFPIYYLTARESRHIKGRYTVTYADILNRRRHPDVVVVCESNFDLKGIAASDLAHCGYTEKDFRKNYTVCIPYRALLPEKLENILVIGRAFSVTHDALSLARMQRDMMAMGGVGGMAASMAVKSGKTLSSVNVRQLQQNLLKLGILSKNDLKGLPPADDKANQRLSKEQLIKLVSELARGTLSLPGQVMVLCHGKAAVPILTEALTNAPQQGKVPLAKALCFLGETEGVPILLDEIRRQFAADRLPGTRQKTHEVPDHGYAPEPVFLINALGLARDRRVLPILKPLARRIKMNPKESDTMFQYVFSICYAAERIADTKAIEALDILADKPGIRSSVLPIGTDPRKTGNVASERYAYLELCVGRALARCGSPRGYRILIDYLRDHRGTYARSAHSELVDLVGKDWGYTPAAWQKWLKQAPKRLPPKPYLKRID